MLEGSLCTKVDGSLWSSADVVGLDWVEDWAGGLNWAGGLTWAEFLAEVWGLAEVLISVEVEGSLLIPKSTSSKGWRVTVSAAGMSGAIGFRVILMPDLNGGYVSDGAVGWGKGIKKSVANMASTDMFVICGNRDTIACISMAWIVSSIKIKWLNLFIQIKFNLYR